MSTDPTNQPPSWRPTASQIKYLWTLAISVLWIASGLLVTYLAMWLGLPSPAPLPPPVMQASEQQVVMAPADEPPPNAHGWVNDPDEVQAFVATMPQPFFAQTPAGQNQDPLPKSVYLWEAYVKLFARPPPPQDQNPVGSCVAFGTCRAIERSLAVQIVQGDPYEFKHLCEEAIYGLSRVEIGKGQLGRGDGSTGAWGAQASRDYGTVPRAVYGRFDLTRYDPNQCRDWGYRGLPDELELEAKKFPVADIKLIRTGQEGLQAMSQGYGVAVCSNQGFARQRDANGTCQPQGSWAHCMAADGFYTADDGQVYVHIENSWGESYHVGPVGPGNPSTAGFYCKFEVFDRMVRNRDRWGRDNPDTWAFSTVKGFPARKIEWFIHKEIHRDPLRLVPHDDRVSGLALAW